MKNKAEKNEKLNPYESDKFAKIPSWVKILLLKYWAAAAAFFFFAVGNPIAKTVDQYFVWIAFGLGLFLEYIVKPIIRFMKTSIDNTSKYNLINLKGIKSLVLNLIYSFLILLPIYATLKFLAKHHMVVNLFSLDDVPAIEPITAGFVFVFYDGVVVLIKNLIIKYFKYKRYKKNEEKANEIIKRIEKKNKEDDSVEC